MKEKAWQRHTVVYWVIIIDVILGFLLSCPKIRVLTTGPPLPDPAAGVPEA